MENLILAIISSSAISVLMRFSDKYVKNNMVMFSANYIVCGLLSFLFLCLDNGIGAFRTGATAGELGFAVGLGVISGVFYLVAFMLLQLNIKLNGMVLAVTFMKLGVLVPIVMSVLLGWDDPTILQGVGCALAVAAIIIINGEGKTEKSTPHGGFWLIVVLLVGGFTNSLSNVYDKLGAASLKNPYLLFIFISATLCSILVFFLKKQHFTWTDAFWGALIGVPNYFSARFLLYALSDVPAIVAYPVYNISAILIISLTGFAVFKEKLSRRKLLGMAVIIAAILVLNL